MSWSAKQALSIGFEQESEGERTYVIDGQWYYSDAQYLDKLHSWSVFTLQWPCIAFAALIGRP